MYTLDRSLDGVDWKEHGQYKDLEHARKDADELWEEGYQVSILDGLERIVYYRDSVIREVAPC